MDSNLELVVMESFTDKLTLDQWPAGNDGDKYFIAE